MINLSIYTYFLKDKNISKDMCKLNIFNYQIFHLHKTYGYGRINFNNYTIISKRQGCPMESWKIITGFPSWEDLFKKGGRIKMNAEEKEQVFAHVEKMLEALNYGSITLVVQDGKIIQIEKNEKIRLQSNKSRWLDKLEAVSFNA